MADEGIQFGPERRGGEQTARFGIEIVFRVLNVQIVRS